MAILFSGFSLYISQNNILRNDADIVNIQIISGNDFMCLQSN